MQPSGVVLLVDDDELYVRACERWFRQQGWSVCTASDVAGALARAREHAPRLVIADIRLGGESGVELIEPLRSIHPGGTIVIASAYLSVALTAQLVRKGAHLVVFKPVDPSEILRQVSRAEVAPHECVTPTLARAEWEHISRVLVDCNGNISEAARRLGILRQSLQRRLRKHAPVH